MARPSEQKPAKPRSTWTRIMQTDYDLGGLTRVSEIPLLGKKGSTCNADCPNQIEVEGVQHVKRGKVAVNFSNSDDG